jgi:hypothetical protein
MAHQYIEQMPEEVQAAVFGNVGTLITFRVGATDAALAMDIVPAPVMVPVRFMVFALVVVRLALAVVPANVRPFPRVRVPVLIFN